jgi:hypothetical protein
MPQLHYDPFENRAAGTIAEMIARQSQGRANAALQAGEAQARAAQQSGAAWSNAIGSIGSMIGAIPGQLQARKQQAQQDDVYALKLQTARDAHAQQQGKVRDEQALDQAYSPAAALGPGGQGPMPQGAAMPDRATILKSLPGHLQPIAEKHFADIDETKAKNRATRDDFFASVAAGVHAFGNDPKAALLALREAEDDYPEQAAKMRELIQQNPSPEFIGQLTQSLIAKSPKYAAQLQKEQPKPAEPFTLGEGQQRFGPTGDLLATGPAKPEPREANATEASLAALAARGDPGAAKALTILRGQRAKAAGADDVTNLSPEGLDAAALNYAKTGMVPPLGMGDKNTRKLIINRAAQMMPGLDIASAKADFTANSASLTGLQKQRDAIGAFEQTAMKNIDVFLDAAGKIVDTGSPLANTLVRQASGKLLGSPDQAAYDAARQVAINEIAKITSNPNLSGTLSDSARHEVDAFNPQNATLKQTVAVMRLLKRDMQNRTHALDEQLGTIKGRIGKASGTTPAAAPVSVSAPNGKTYTFKSQADADAFKAKAGIK